MAYPKFLAKDFITTYLDTNRTIYLIKKYRPGKTVLLTYSQDGDVRADFGQWSGHKTKPDPELLKTSLGQLVMICKQVKTPSCQFFFSEDGALVDVHLQGLKFMSPGMLKDLFGKAVKIQDVVAITNVGMLDTLTEKGEFVIKPARPSVVEHAGKGCVAYFLASL